MAKLLKIFFETNAVEITICAQHLKGKALVLGKIKPKLDGTFHIESEHLTWTDLSYKSVQNAKTAAMKLAEDWIKGFFH